MKVADHLLQRLIQDLQTSDSLSRLSFIHSPSSQSPTLSGPSSILARLITADALSKITPERLLSILGLNEATEDAAQQPLTDSADSVLADLPESPDAYEKYVDACRLVVRSLGLKSGELAVIVNGRVRRMPLR